MIQSDLCDQDIHEITTSPSIAGLELQQRALFEEAGGSGGSRSYRDISILREKCYIHSRME